MTAPLRYFPGAAHHQAALAPLAPQAPGEPRSAGARLAGAPGQPLHFMIYQTRSSGTKVFVIMDKAHAASWLSRVTACGSKGYSADYITAVLAPSSRT